MKKINQNVILLLLGSFLILCYLLVSFYCHPSGDDFTYAVRGNSDNFLETVLNERNRWNGRYISNFLVLFSPLNWGGLLGYKLMPIVLIGCIILGTSFFFKTILGKHSILLTLVSTLITFSVMPDITEGVYWYTGAWTYIPGGILFFVALSLMIKFWKRFKLYHYLLISFLCFIASGFNEVIPILGISIFGFATLQNSKDFKFIVFLTLFISFLAYMTLAPGNSYRSEHFINKHQLFYSLLMSSTYTVRFIGEWIINPALFFWGIFILKMNFKSSYLDKIAFFKNPFFVLFALIFPTFLCCFGPIWSTGLLGQYRTANLACYIFLITYTLVVIVNKDFILRKLKFQSLLKYGFLILILFLTLWKNQFSMLQELLNGEISKFNQDMYERYDIINECEKRDCCLPIIENNSRTLFVYPLKDDPNHWMNRSYELYFNTGKIIKCEN